MTIRDEKLGNYVDQYLGAIRKLHYADLVRLQNPPRATVYHGAGGTAYALWRLGERQLAARWLDEALGDRRAGAYLQGEQTSSYQFGRAGVHWVRALVGCRGAAAHYMRLTRRARSIEFMSGAAGHLTGARLLLQQRTDRSLRSFAEGLARRLLRHLRARIAQPWTAADAAGGFAHDWMGVLHALLEWQRASGGGLAPWFRASLVELARMWSPRTVRNPTLHGAWCHGATGAVLLWCSAHAATGDPVFLRCAREAGQVALAAVHPSPDLCCGEAGAAFACLELERIDPSAGWRAHAREIGARVIVRPTLAWPNGLFRGHPGLVCLALDLAGAQWAGFPAILG